MLRWVADGLIYFVCNEVPWIQFIDTMWMRSLDPKSRIEVFPSCAKSIKPSPEDQLRRHQSWCWKTLLVRQDGKMNQLLSASRAYAIGSSQVGKQFNKSFKNSPATFVSSSYSSWLFLPFFHIFHPSPRLFTAFESSASGDVLERPGHFCRVLQPHRGTAGARCKRAFPGFKRCHLFIQNWIKGLAA